MSRALYFAYGSNLDADQMSERCPGSQALFRARLHDHRLDFTHFSRRWQGGAADVVPHEGGVVWGVVYELSTLDLGRLDRFETGYDRLDLEVHDDADTAHPALSYTVRSKRSFRPSPAYLQKMVTWSERWDFPDPYVELLRSAGIQGPPDS